MKRSLFQPLFLMILASAATAPVAYSGDVECGYGAPCEEGPMNHLNGGFKGMHDMMGSLDLMRVMGMGPMGMMGEWPLEMLNLSDAQRKQVNTIRDDVRKKNWTIMGNIMDQRALMRDQFEMDEPDPQEVGRIYGKISDLRRQIIINNVTAMNKVREVLTPAQRQQLKQWRKTHAWSHGEHMSGHDSMQWHRQMGVPTPPAMQGE